MVSLQDINNIYQKLIFLFGSCESGSAEAVISLCILQEFPEIADKYSLC